MHITTPPRLTVYMYTGHHDPVSSDTSTRTSRYNGPDTKSNIPRLGPSAQYFITMFIFLDMLKHYNNQSSIKYP